MNSEANTSVGPKLLALELLRVPSLLGVLVAQLYLTSLILGVPVDYCFTKPFWLDEFHTLALIKEDNVGQLLSKLSQGADFNPPALHLALWSLAKVTQLPDELLLRTFSSTVGVIGIVAAYFLLRIRFSWLVSFVAVIGMWSSQPLLLREMFDGRFYSFWYAAIAVFCLSLNESAKGVWQFICVAALAALGCSIHYFGIIALGLIAVCELCVNFGDTRKRWLVAVALVAGTITLIALLPTYSGQRAALPVPTWVKPPTLHDSVKYINDFVLSYAFAFPVLAYAVQRLVGGAPTVNCYDFKTYAGVCGLILMPLVLTIFSYAIQPAQIDRYSIPAILAYAPLIALITNRLKMPTLTVLGLLFWVVGLINATEVFRIRPNYHEVTYLAKMSTVDRPLIVHSRHIAYPLVRYAEIDPHIVRISYLFRGDLTRFENLEQTVARHMAKLFELPNTIDVVELESLDEFYLLTAKGEEQRYHGWKAEPLEVYGEFDWSLHGYHMRRSR